MKWKESYKGDYYSTLSGPVVIVGRYHRSKQIVRFLRTGNEEVLDIKDVCHGMVVDKASNEKPSHELLVHVVTNRQEADEYVRACQSERQ